MARVSSGTKAERFEFIKNHGSALGVRYLCNWLEVSFQGFYKWKKRPESKRVKENRANHKRIARIMKNSGLVGKAAKIYRRKALPERFYLKHPNLKLDMPQPSNINQQWAGDITYLKVGGEWRYLAVVMDLYSRRIIGWDLGRYKNAELTRSALKKALSHRKVEDGLIFHTDRGSEYGAYLIQDELTKAGIKSSMNRPDSLTDNIHVESFFRTLKTECYHGLSFKNENDLRVALSYYLDSYYNEKRSHTSLEFTAPTQYEKMAA